MPAVETLTQIRIAARSFEEGLPSSQRKRLGQFFTGFPLSALLAHLAVDDNCSLVADPMAGHGNLLDAAAIAARARGITLERLDGIELDSETAEFCHRRMGVLQTAGLTKRSKILSGSAFNPANLSTFDADGYDLVITNPPYVRYQTQSVDGAADEDVRRGLGAIVKERSPTDERTLWTLLVEGYSGLADLSVPAWILSALMTRPGGRLALVAPATWRSRDYAAIVRYLLLRFFSLELVVSDKQPGWFSDALVRTHLVIARRLQPQEAALPLSVRGTWNIARWLEVAPEAANQTSLVGGAFPGAEPEASLAAWIATNQGTVTGVESRSFSLKDEWQSLSQHSKGKSWFQKAENQDTAFPLFSRVAESTTAALPQNFREMLPPGVIPTSLNTLRQADIHVGQGLRTGCNRFFYVTLLESKGPETVTVQASDSFNKLTFEVPADAVQPVLHRQAEAQAVTQGQLPSTRALVLSNWILPEDEPATLMALEVYRMRGQAAPRIMPQGLAAFVRSAALYAPDAKAPGRVIPSLSAVRTNVRQPDGQHAPRFWYMLPPFTPRHMPPVFLPRINNGTPAVGLNALHRILIDANFSTAWSEAKRWTSYALYALFNSSWCRAGMESIGTPLGGGALKLEATHIRQIPIPSLTDSNCQRLDTLGHELAASAPAAQCDLDTLVLAAALPNLSSRELERTAQYLEARIRDFCNARQKTRP